MVADSDKPVRVAIIGSRNFADQAAVTDYVRHLPANAIIISGGAVGVDTWAAEAAKLRDLKVVVYLPDWTTFGKTAGFIRNQKIVDDCDRLVAFWDGRSNGTRHSIGLATKAGKLEKVFNSASSPQGSLF